MAVWGCCCMGMGVWLCGGVVWLDGVWGCGCMEVWLYGLWGYGGVAFILMRTKQLSHSSACSEIWLVIKGVCCLLDVIITMPCNEHVM